MNLVRLQGSCGVTNFHLREAFHIHVVTHLLVGWTLAEGLEGRRGKTVVAWCSVVPDLDGLGYVVDLVTLHTAFPQTHYYEMFHRLWGHGLPAALVIALIVFLVRRNVLVAALALTVAASAPVHGRAGFARQTQRADLAHQLRLTRVPGRSRHRVVRSVAT